MLPTIESLGLSMLFLKVLGILKPFFQEGFKRGSGAEPLVLLVLPPLNPNFSQLCNRLHILYSKEDAEKIKAQLVEAGATVEIK